MKRPLASLAVLGAVLLGCDTEDPAATATSPESAPATVPARAFATPATIPGVSNFAKVSDALYRGAQPTAEGMQELKRRGIKTIVNLRDFHSDRDEMHGTGLQYVHIKAAAWHPEEEDVVKFLKVMADPANRPVFVHCWQGSDRTGMMVAAYRATEESWPLPDAIKEMRNFGFHPVWKDIQKYVDKFDVERVRKKVQESKPVKTDRVD